MTRALSDFFQKDHQEIDALMAAVDFASPEADEDFSDFARRLERHIGWEERLLFPAAADAEPALSRGPIAVMLAEHEQIRGLIKAVEDALESGEKDAARERAGELQDLLAAHNMKEERILYPACDDLLGPTGAKRVLDSLPR